MMEDVLVKLNPGMPWQKQHLTRRGFGVVGVTLKVKRWSIGVGVNWR
jgi:hypothetical protein